MYNETSTTSQPENLSFSSQMESDNTFKSRDHFVNTAFEREFRVCTWNHEDLFLSLYPPPRQWIFMKILLVSIEKTAVIQVRRPQFP